MFGYCPLLYTKPADMFSMLNLSQTWIKNSNRREILFPQFSPAALRVEPTFLVIIGSKFGTQTLWWPLVVVVSALSWTWEASPIHAYYCGRRSVPMHTVNTAPHFLLCHLCHLVLRQISELSKYVGEVEKARVLSRCFIECQDMCVGGSIIVCMP